MTASVGETKEEERLATERVEEVRGVGGRPRVERS